MISDVASKKKELGKFIVQYQETDWEFLKRLASHFHTNAIQLSIISVVFCHREPMFFMPKNFKNITKNS